MKAYPKDSVFMYAIKDYTGLEFDSEFKWPFSWKLGNAEDAAKQISEDKWHQDPRDPSNVEDEIGVIDPDGNEYWFVVKAEASVDFYVADRPKL